MGDTKISMLINAQLATAEAVASLQSMTAKIGQEGSKINKILENAFKPMNSLGTGGGVFAKMSQSIKEMQNAIRSLSNVMTTGTDRMEASMNNVKSAVDIVNSSIMNLSTALKTITEREYKIRIKEEIVSSGGKRSSSSSFRSGKSKDDDEVIPANLLSARSGIIKNVAEMINPTRAEIEKLVKGTALSSGKTIGKAFNQEVINKFIDTLTQATAAQTPLGMKDFKDRLNRWVADNRKSLKFDDIKNKINQMIASNQFTFGKADISAEATDKMARRIASANMMVVPDTGVDKFKESALSKSMTHMLKTRLGDVSTKNVSVQQAIAAESLLQTMRGKSVSKKFNISLAALEQMGIDLGDISKSPQFKQMLAGGKSVADIKNDIIVKFSQSIRRSLESVARKIVKDFDSQTTVPIAQAAPSKASYIQSGPVTNLPKNYRAWQQGQFAEGSAFFDDARKYINFAVKQQGQTPEQVMRTLMPHIDKNIPAGNSSMFAQALGLDPKEDFANKLSKIAASAAGAKQPVDSLGRSLSTVGNIMHKQGEAVLRLGRYYASFFLITSALREVREVFRQTIKFQEEMLEVQKFLPSGENVGSLRAEAYKIAAITGNPIDTVLGSYTEFAKQGKKSQEILDFTKVALMGVNVASTDFKTTVTYLTTATNVWKDETKDLIGLIDKLAIVQAKSSASSEVLISAMQRSASMAKTMGISQDQLFGYISAVSEKTQLSGEVIGTSLRTIFSRARRQKTIELLESTPALQGQLFSGRTSGQLASAPQILDAVAKSWRNLTDEQQRNIATQMAGERQMNAFISLMGNYERANTITAASITSFGFAQKANETEMQKFSKVMQRLSVIVHEATTSVFLPLINTVAKIGGVTADILTPFSSLIKVFSGGLIGMTAFVGGIALVKSGLLFLSQHAANATLATSNFNTLLGRTITRVQMFGLTSRALAPLTIQIGLVYKGLVSAARAALMLNSSLGFVGGLTAAFNGLLSLLGPISLVASALGTAMLAYNSMTQSAAEKQDDLNNRLKETIDLAKQLSNVSSIEERRKLSEKAAEKLKPEDYKQFNIPIEWDTQVGKYVPAFTNAKDTAGWQQRLQAGYVQSPNRERTLEEYQALANVLNLSIDKLVQTFGGTKESFPDAINALKTIREYMDIPVEKLKLQLYPGGIENEKERGQYIHTQNILKTGVKPSIQDYMAAIVTERKYPNAQIGRQIAQDFYSPLNPESIIKSGLLTNPEFISALKQIPQSAINEIYDTKNIEEYITKVRGTIKKQQTDSFLKEYSEQNAINEKQAFDAYRNIIDINVGRKQNRLVNQGIISEPTIAEYLETLKLISTVEKNIQKIQLDAATQNKKLDDEEIESKIRVEESKLRALDKIKKDLTFGQSPEKMLEAFRNKVINFVKFAPVGQEEVYEKIAIDEMKRIESAWATILSSGTINLDMPDEELSRLLKYKAMSEKFTLDVMQARKTREELAKQLALDQKLNRKLIIETMKYTGDIVATIDKQKAIGGIDNKWIDKYDIETKRLMNELEVTRAADKAFPAQTSKDKALRAYQQLELENKIKSRKAYSPDKMRQDKSFFGIQRYDFTPEAMEYDRKMFEQYYKQTIKGGISKEFYGGLTSKIETYKTSMAADTARLEQADKTGALSPKQTEEIQKHIALTQELIIITEKYRSLASQGIVAMGAEEYLNKTRESIEKEVALTKERLALTDKQVGLTERLQSASIASDKILDLNLQINKAQTEQNEAIRTGETVKANAAAAEITNLTYIRDRWQEYKDSIYGISPAIQAFKDNMDSALKAIQLETQTGIKFIDDLINRLYSIAGKIFTIGINFLTTDNIDSGDKDAINKIQELKNFYKGLSSSKKSSLGGELKAQAKVLLDAYALSKKINKANVQDADTQKFYDLMDQVDKDFSYDKGAARKAERDKESQAHYDALERIKKAEFAFQQQQKLASYWENKMPDKYLLKYDAETAKYKAELKAKEDALAAEGANLKDDEVKRFKEEIEVLKTKISLQEQYRQKAIEISEFEKFQSDNRIGIEKLRTQLSITQEIYDLEFSALASPTRAEEKQHMEWKIKAKILELETERAIQIEENKRIYMSAGKNEQEALAMAMDNEQLKLLDLKIAKEQALLGLVDRQLEIKEKQKITDQVKEIQGMVSNTLFDVFTNKGKEDIKKQLAELSKELSSLMSQSEQTSYGLAEAEGTGNIDRINTARDKWGDINKQMEETRKKMDEVNNSTNKWKELLQNIGDSVLKKISDKLADMLMNQTGIGDIFGSVFGGIEKIGGGNKSRLSAPALPTVAGMTSALLGPGSDGLSKAISNAIGNAPQINGFTGAVNPTTVIVNQSSGGGGINLGSMLGGQGGLNFGKSSTNVAASAAKTKSFGPINYLTAAMLGYGIGSSTSNRAVGVLGGAAAGFLTAGPIGAVLGALGGLFGRKKNEDTPPPPAPAREFYPLAQNTSALDRNTAALMKISEGVFNSPSVFEMNKLQSENNAPRQVFNLNVNVSGNMSRAAATKVGNTILQTVSQGLAQSAPRVATNSTANWG
ncbi:MAG TPA: phage tail tape measure protein [Methanofastidiosum sp.]|nr:phage tail tape measure protein [Methanofastidiosum sp.]